MTDDSQNPSTASPAGSPPTPDRVKQDFQTAAQALGAAAEDIRDEAMSEAGNLKDTATAQLADATDKAKGFASERKDMTADQLGGVSTAISKVADELGNNEDTAAVAGYARDLAGGIQRVSETVRNNSVDDILGMVEDFGRRQPIAFLGAAALAGFVASRFVLASAERREAKLPPEPAGPPGGYASTTPPVTTVPANGGMINTNGGGAFE